MRLRNLDKGFWFLMGMVLIMLVVTGIVGSDDKYKNKNIAGPVYLLEQWEKESGQEFISVNLPFSFLGQEAAEKPLRFHFVIKEEWQFEGTPSLMVSANFCKIKVLLNGELIFDEEPEEGGFSRVDGIQYHFISIPQDYAGKELVIELLPALGESLTYKIRTPILGRSMDIFFFELSKEWWSILLALILIFLGMELILVSCITQGKVGVRNSMAQLGIASLCCGLYLCCQITTIQIVAPNTYAMYYLELAVLALLIVSVVAIIRSQVRGLLKMIYDGLMCAFTGIIILQWILNFFMDIDLWRTLFLTHSMISVFVIVLIFTCIRKEETDTRARKEIIISVVPVVIGTVIDTAFFYLAALDRLTPFSRMGLIVFICLQFRYNYKHYMEGYQQRIEEKTYTMLAFKDVMTCLSNRRAFERDVKQMNQEGKNMTCFSIDLNGLKATNDTYGHKQGDLLLNGMGEILQQVTQEKGTAYRIGGDEFAILLDEVTREEYEGVRKHLEQVTEVYNTEHALGISFAVGMAVFDEKRDKNLMDTLVRADAAMYEEKRKQKEHLLY